MESAPAEIFDDEPPLAVLMPAYNERDGIEAAVHELCRCILDQVPNSYAIVVNDGSKDGTATILDKLSNEDSRIHVIHKPNSGHGPSLVCALNQAHAKYVFLIDSDMQIPLDCFPKLWETVTAPQVDGVFGIRLNRQDPMVRKQLSRIIAFTLGILFQVRISDANAPCKIFRRKIWSELYTQIQEEALLAPSILIAIFAFQRKYNIVELPVLHRAREHGAPSLRLKPLIRLCWKGFRQLIQLKEKLS